jgi:hypothetical protein
MKVRDKKTGDIYKVVEEISYYYEISIKINDEHDVYVFVSKDNYEIIEEDNKMKEYSLQEIFNEEEGMEFLRASGGCTKYIIKDGELFCTDYNKEYTIKPVLNKRIMNLKFKKVQSPVSFMDVINSTKKCRIEHELVNNDEYSQNYHELYDLMYVMSEWYTSDELKTVIKEGKWYLEE